MAQDGGSQESPGHDEGDAPVDRPAWHRHLDELADSVADGIVIADATCRVRHVNPAAERIFGQTREQLLGRSCDDPAWNMTLADGAPIEGAHPACRCALETGQAARSIEQVVTRPDGSRVPVLVSASPLHDEDRIIGVITAYTDITALKMAEDDLREQDEYNSSLLQLYAVLGRANTYTAIVRALAPEVERALGYKSISLYLVDSETQTARMLEVQGEAVEPAETLMQWDARYRAETESERFLVLPCDGDPYLEECFEGTHVVIVEDARTDPRTNKELAEVTGMVTAINVPLVLAGEMLGIFALYTFLPEGARLPTARQLDYLTKLSNHIAVAIDRVRFLGERLNAEDALKRSLEEVEAALDGIVRALASTTGERDPYTALHQERVARLACAIAEEMGLPEAKIEEIRVAGVLHDIGKITVPTEILSKPSALSEMEFGIIRTHSEVGARLLQGVPFHTPVAKIVLQHHERLDGSGYPDGLVADEILPEAKILAVADVVEAMASHRPYRPALGIEAALEEIERGAGVKYDREVVAACATVLGRHAIGFT